VAVKRKIPVCAGNPTPVVRVRRHRCSSYICGSYCVKYGAGILLIFFEGCIMSTDEEIITARKEIDAHEQEFMVNEELLRLILKILAQCAHSLHATRNILVFSAL
jgi:hypothetical protein